MFASCHSISIGGSAPQGSPDLGLTSNICCSSLDVWGRPDGPVLCHSQTCAAILTASCWFAIGAGLPLFAIGTQSRIQRRSAES